MTHNNIFGDNDANNEEIVTSTTPLPTPSPVVILASLPPTTSIHSENNITVGEENERFTPRPIEWTFTTFLLLFVVICFVWAPNCKRPEGEEDEDQLPSEENANPDSEEDRDIATTMLNIFMRNNTMSYDEDREVDVSTVDHRRDFVMTKLVTKKIKETTPPSTSNSEESFICEDNSLPKKRNKSSSSSPLPTTSSLPDSTLTCAICLVEYDVGDEISYSRNKSCPHAFHKQCIVEWLINHDECPCCRQDYLASSSEDEHDMFHEHPDPLLFNPSLSSLSLRDRLSVFSILHSFAGPRTNADDTEREQQSSDHTPADDNPRFFSSHYLSHVTRLLDDVTRTPDPPPMTSSDLSATPAPGDIMLTPHSVSMGDDESFFTAYSRDMGESHFPPTPATTATVGSNEEDVAEREDEDDEEGDNGWNEFEEGQWRAEDEGIRIETER